MTLTVPILYGMTPRDTKLSVDPAQGRKLKAQRVRMGLTQEQVVDMSDGVLYPRLLSELENSKRSVLELSVEQAMTLMSVLGYERQALANDFGENAPPIPDAPALPNAEDYHPTLAVPMFGAVAAGLSGDLPDPEQSPFYLDPSIPGIRGRAARKLAVMRVNGDSMVSPNVLHSIPKGSLIVVERGAYPEIGETVVAWIAELDLSVLKKLEEPDDVVLTSLNPSGPVFRASEYSIDIRGVVRLVIKAP